ncbi:SARP family transcriptional regulator [Paractinoplanes rishiriensis]|uniref:SARP family transcriptional regulator n=1 Tax=Paractinoplanes rishiriensis TaxID=1050105 RepID=A0A919JQL3_9ACTN|nr:SARP family transcriptional regulator [Actinoplanes rishiriensis]
MLALLALHAGRAVGVSALVDALWPDGAPRSARNSLQSHVARLRGTLGAGGGAGADIVLEPAGYRLVVPRDDVDALLFEDLVGRPEGLADALALWRGEPLGEFPGEPFQGIAVRLRSLYRDGLVRHGDVGRLAEVVAGDPCWESGVVALATAFARNGQRGEALELLRRHSEALVGEQGLDPSQAVRELQAAVARGELAPRLSPQRAQRPGPDAEAAGVPRGRPLPVPLRFSSFVGRERELSQLAGMIAEPGTVTVTGPGGVGKTRLVSEAVRQAERAAWVDGADVLEADFVPAVAVALGVRIGPLDDAFAAIGRAAKGYDVVVLDNCEHLLTAALNVVEAMRGARVVVTSQERLRADGERLLALAPLDEKTAARLFLERAGVHGEEDDVGDIVRRLDLLPLAIELAATQAAALGVGELRERLDDRLDLLVRGRRDGDARHRTLRAVVDWSFGLLDDAAQTVLRRLAVFAGGFTIAQAEAVVADPSVPRQRVAAVLAVLVERSLVVRHGAGRFRLLETVRAYAAEHGDLAETEARHAAAMVAAAEELDAAVHGPEQAVAVREIDALLPDLRLAFARGDTDARIRLAAAMYRYGYHCQHYEVLFWGRAAIGAEGHPRASQALAAAATHAWGRGDLAEARALAESVVPSAAVHEVLGDVALVTCDGAGAAEHYRAMDGSPVAKVSALVGEALVLAWSGRTAEAIARGRHACDISDLTGNPSARAEARYGLGEALGDSDPHRALDLLAEAVEIAKEADDRLFGAAAGTAAVAIRSRHGDPATALASFREVLALWRRAGNDTLQTAALRNLVVLLVRVGADETAVLVDAALPTACVYPAEAARLDRARQAAAERLGPDRVAALREAGAALSPARVTDEASRAIDAALARLSG